MKTRRSIIAAKIESVEGTAEALTVAEAGIMCLSPKFEADFKMYDRSNVMLGTLSKLQSVAGTKSGKISFQAELKGTGVAYSAVVKPAIGMYLRACSMSETVVTTAGSETVTYLPASSGAPSLTIWVYVDGIVQKLKGCRGTAKIDAKIGEAFIVSFDFTGVYDGVADLGMISPTLEATTPPTFLNAGLTFGGYAATCESFSADLGNQVQLRSDVNSATGFLSAIVADRKPTCTIDPEMVTVATRDYYGLWAAGTPAALNIGPVGTGNYNKITITAPKLITSKISAGDRSGSVTAGHTCELAMNTGDDEISIVFSK